MSQDYDHILTARSIDDLMRRARRRRKWRRVRLGLSLALRAMLPGGGNP